MTVKFQPRQHNLRLDALNRATQAWGEMEYNRKRHRARSSPFVRGAPTWARR